MALTEEQDLMIAAYALGVLEGEERHAVAAMLAESPEAGDRLESWRRRLAPLEMKAAPSPPPAAVWAGISERLGFASGIRSTFNDAGRWVPVKPGVEIRYLDVDPVSEARSALLRMAQGAVLDPHHHANTERCFIVEGEVAIGGGVFRKNDFHVAPLGTVHQEVKAVTPAMLLLYWS